MANYDIPENPAYSPEITKLEDSNLASATNLFNPLFQRIITNIHALSVLLGKTAVLKGPDDPTEQTAGAVGQQYLNTATGALFVCVDIKDGVYIWTSSGATDASGIDVDGRTLDEVLADLQKLIDDGAVLLAMEDPTESTKGIPGQFYFNADSEVLFICVSAEDGVYKWITAGGGSGPVVLPQIVALVATGAVVICTNGATVLSAESVDGKAAIDVPGYGNWTLQATLDGHTSDSVTVTVDQVMQYVITLSSFEATLTVTAEPDAEVTASSGPNIFTGICGNDGKAVLAIKYADTYSVSATKNDATSSTESVAITTAGESYTAEVTFMTLTVTIDDGSDVTVSNGSTVFNVISDGPMKFYLPNAGTWDIAATLSGETATGSVAVSAYTDYTIELSYVKITGVEWNYANASTALTRLTKTSDPNSLVTVNILTEPIPAVGTGSGSSPFDNLAPWNGMDEFNVINNEIAFQKGETGFSRTTNDTVVRIPAFWYKTEKVTASSKMRFYVADKPKAGFSIHPAFDRGDGKVRDCIYVGKYNSGASYVSKSGIAPIVNMTRAVARTGSSGKGTPWWQFDYAAWCAIGLLYLVEFADWDSQKKVGRGYVDGNSAAINSGATDVMAYHTGRPTGTDGKTAVMYRCIENPWGNVHDWVDGCNANNRLVHACLNPAQFADDTVTNYRSTGLTLPESGWTKEIGRSETEPWAFVPITNGGSETTYVADYVSSATGWRVLLCGGGWSGTGAAGLFCFTASNAASYVSASVGARLLYLP